VRQEADPTRDRFTARSRCPPPTVGIYTYPPSSRRSRVPLLSPFECFQASLSELVRVTTGNSTTRGGSYLLSGPQAADKADYYAAGPLAERVTDAAGNESRVLIDTCTDYTDRKVYKEGSDDFVEDFNFGVIRTRAVMTQAAKGWILRDISLPDEQNCE
jgi:hypothetical protein